MIQSGLEMLATSILIFVLGLAFIFFGLAWWFYCLPTRLLQWTSR